MKRLFLLLMVCLGLVAVGVFASSEAAVGRGATVVRVSPAVVELDPGESTTVEVWVDNVEDLAGFAVEIHFDPDLVLASDLVLGSFLDYGGFIITKVDNNLGTLSYDFAQTGFDNIQSGSDVLFSFKLTTKNVPGAFQLEIINSDLVGVEGINHFPINHTVEHGSVRIIGAVDDEYQLIINETLSVDAPGVLANDILPAGVDYQAELVEDIPPGEGMLDLFTDGSFTYDPPEDWVGTTSFTYRACHNDSCTEPATVTIHVGSDQDPDWQIFLPLVMRQ